VTGLLRIGKTNRLEVKIARMPEALAAVFASSDNPGGSEVGKAANAVRQYLKDLKSPTNCAWDWAFAVWTLGIWKDVRLEMTGPARIDWVRVQSQLSDNHTKASIKATLEIDSVVPGNVRARFRIMGHEAQAVSTVDAVLKKGTNEVEAVLPLDSPALWWPNGQGEQALYELESSVVESASGVVFDTRTTRFAVREVEWRQAPGAAPDFINPLKLVLNGRPIRQMGSNLVPPDLLFGRINQRGPRLIEQAQAAGMNMLRVWDPGVILPDQVYDRADELGIMLMQGFALANCTPERDAVFLSNLEATVTSIIKQVRNHPSIVEWSGGNEMEWQQGTDHPALKLLERLVRQYDGRILRATEPAQGSAVHGTYTYVYHNAPAPYLTWLGAGKEKNLYEVYDGFNSMRLSEFGTNSPANLEVWHQTVPPASQWPLNNTDDPVLIRKNVFWGAVLPQNWLHKEITESLFGSLDGLGACRRYGL
jgi:beta-mannosidase